LHVGGGGGYAIREGKLNTTGKWCCYPVNESSGSLISGLAERLSADTYATVATDATDRGIPRQVRLSVFLIRPSEGEMFCLDPIRISPT
jgi:hypothetical protein